MIALVCEVVLEDSRLVASEALISLIEAGAARRGARHALVHDANELGRALVDARGLIEVRELTTPLATCAVGGCEAARFAVGAARRTHLLLRGIVSYLTLTHAATCLRVEKWRCGSTLSANELVSNISIVDTGVTSWIARDAFELFVSVRSIARAACLLASLVPRLGVKLEIIQAVLGPARETVVGV